MLESWFIYALLSALFAGLFSYSGKISAEKEHNSMISIWYSCLSSAFFSFVLFLIMWWKIDPLWLVLILSVWNGVFYMISLVARNKALKSIDSTIFFPIHKVVAWMIVTFIGVVIFRDLLSLWETLWVIVWMFVPLILITKKENSLQKNLKLWVIITVIWSISSWIAISFGKTLAINNLSILAFISVTWITWWVITLIAWKEKYKNVFVISWNKIKRYALMNWFLLTLSMYFFIKSMEWNLAIVYTINSFSILIPIILSVIFYKEKLGIRKVIVILLSILSILLFKLF